MITLWRGVTKNVIYCYPNKYATALSTVSGRQWMTYPVALLSCQEKSFRLSLEEILSFKMLITTSSKSLKKLNYGSHFTVLTMKTVHLLNLNPFGALFWYDIAHFEERKN